MSRYLQVLVTLAVACLLSKHIIAQRIDWMVGEWDGNSMVPGSSYTTQFMDKLDITKINGNKLEGIRYHAIADENKSHIDSEVFGTMKDKKFIFMAGDLMDKKEPPTGTWADCRNCVADAYLEVYRDRVTLVSSSAGCGSLCDGKSIFKRALIEFDTATQRHIVNNWGDASLKKSFVPIQQPGTDRKLIDALRSQQSKEQQSTQQPAKPQQPPSKDTLKKTPESKPTKPLSELQRRNIVIAQYETKTPDIRILIYDNGEIDGDSITLFHNQEKVVANKKLTGTAIEYKVTATAQNREHSFTLVANNLGTIPPNTALVYIITGGKKYELRSSTKLDENARIIVYYSGD